MSDDEVWSKSICSDQSLWWIMRWRKKYYFFVFKANRRTMISSTRTIMMSQTPMQQLKTSITTRKVHIKWYSFLQSYKVRWSWRSFERTAWCCDSRDSYGWMVRKLYKIDTSGVLRHSNNKPKLSFIVSSMKMLLHVTLKCLLIRNQLYRVTMRTFFTSTAHV